MALVLDVLKHIGRNYSPLNLANMKIYKLKFVQNTAPDNKRGFKVHAQLLPAHILTAQPLPAHILAAQY